MPTYPLYSAARNGDATAMFLRAKTRTKDGKTHRYWSIVENRRLPGGRVVQRQALYLGELNDGQRASWVRTIEVIERKGEARQASRQMALFASDGRPAPELSCEAVRVRLDQIQLLNPRQWGACWLALHLWNLLDLDRFWAPRLPPGRKAARWLNVLKALTCYRLIDPGSEWRFHREWFLKSAMADLPGEDFALAQKDKPYRCLDRITAHRDDLFSFLQERWRQLFKAEFDVLLYDLTSTCFESDPPPPDSRSKKRFGYSRDHRSDCVQVVLALVVTPDGFPLAYEIDPGNTRDTATLEAFLKHIEQRYGKARRIWLMDRGVPTEDTLEKMRGRGNDYLVGTPKGRLTELEKDLRARPWIEAREGVRVKGLELEGELYVYVESRDRVAKERSMRRRRLKRLWARLKELRARKRLTRDDLLMDLGAAKKDAGRAYGLVMIHVPAHDEPVNETTFRFELNRKKLRRAIRREGRYLLRSTLRAQPPEALWEACLKLARIEQAFKDLKGDLAVRPLWHQKDARIEVHIFVCFLAYCLHAALRNLACGQAAGLTSRAILDKVSTIQMIDVHLPAEAGRRFLLPRYTQPENDAAILLAQLGLTLPQQPSPRLLEPLSPNRAAPVF